MIKLILGKLKPNNSNNLQLLKTCHPAIMRRQRFEYQVTLLRPNPNQIYMVKTTGDLPMMYPRLISVIKYQGFELCRNGQDILRCFVCGGAQGGWQSTLPHTKSKGGSDCSDAASKLMLSCSLVWLGISALDPEINDLKGQTQKSTNQ